jgi:hypothetical protein
MVEHVAMDEPFARIAEDAEDLAAFLALQQRRVAQRAKAAVGAPLVEVMTVRVDAMRKAGVVHQRQGEGLPALEPQPRRIGQMRDVVEAPDVAAGVLAAHGAALHPQGRPQAHLTRRG